MKYYPQQVIVNKLMQFSFLEQIGEWQLVKGDSTLYIALGSEDLSQHTSLSEDP
jgi:hypothetical protein